MPTIANLAPLGGNAALLNDAVIDFNTYKFGPGAIKIDGASNSYFKSSNTFALGTSDWCLEFWANLSATQTNSTIRLAQISKDLPNEFSDGHLSIGISSGTLNVFAYDFNAVNALITTSTNIQNVGWTHVALSREGSTFRLFVNGVIVGTATWAGSITGTNSWLFGGNGFTPRAFDGWMDEVRFTLGVARYTSTFTAPSTSFTSSEDVDSDQYYSNVSLLLHFEGVNGTQTATDSSQSPLTPTFVGASPVLTSLYQKFGSTSMSFNGTAGHYIAYNGESAFAFGTEDFTIECWFNLNAANINNFNTIWAQRPAGSNNASITVFTTGTTFWLVSDGTGYTGSVSLTGGVWYHMAVSRNGTNLKAYINGTVVATRTNDTTNYINIANRPRIGEDGYGFAGYTFSGYIDELRVTKGVGRYPNNFTAPTKRFYDNQTVSFDSSFSNNVKLLLHMEGLAGSTTFTDSSVTQKVVTATGNAAITTTQYRIGTSSATFDGSGDSLTIPDSPDFNLGTGDFTIEMWIRPTSLASNQDVLAHRNTADTNNFYYIRVLATTGQIQVYAKTANVVITDITSVAGVSINTWANIAVVRASGVTKIYINGANSDTVTTNAATAWPDVAYPFVIGASDNASGWFTGQIDELRLTKGVARYTASFTPINARFYDSSDNYDPYYASNVVLLLSMNGTPGSSTFTDSSPSVKATTATATLSETQFKFGGASGIFNNTSVNVTDTSFFNVGALTDFCIECWIYVTNNTANYYGIFAKNGANVINSFGLEIIGPGNTALYLRRAFNSNGNYDNPCFANFTFAVNTWYHVALVRVNGTFQIYIDGVNRTSATTSGINLTNANTFRVGTGIFGNMVGYIDDFRITVGQARYTQAFTPPTLAFFNGVSTSDPFSSSVRLLYAADTYLQPLVKIRDTTQYRKTADARPNPSFKANLNNQFALRRLNISGRGKIYGTVKIKGTPNYAVYRKVRLFRDIDGLCIDEKWSDPTTGNYEFLGVDETLKYTVISYDYQNNFRAVIADNLTPEIYL